MRVLSASLVSLLCLGAAQVANAAMVFTGATLNQNFNTNTLPQVSTSGFFPISFAATALGDTGWVGAKIGGTSGVMSFTVANPDSTALNAGSVVSAGSNSSNERAIGSIINGQQIPRYGVEIVNNSAFAITEISISFTQENWQVPRDASSVAAVVNTVLAEYGTSADGLTSANFLTSVTGFQVASDLNMVSPNPVVNSETAQGRRNGNLVENQVFRTDIISLSTPLPVGSSFFLRFTETDDAGIDAVMAVDNFSFTAVPEPTGIVMAILGASVIGLFRVNRRR